MSIFKDDVNTSDVLGAYLSYTPSYSETEQFRTDLRCLNHTLLRDAIAECVKADTVHPNADPQTKRQKIHSVYVRKIKELSSLYPFLFSVESALRARAQETYSAVFKNAYWWKTILNANDNDIKPSDFGLVVESGRKFRILCGIQVNPAFIKESLFSISQLTERQKRGLRSPECPASAYYDRITLKGLAAIIDADYRIFSMPDMTRNDFNRSMEVILDARNELYHSNPIRNRNRVYLACERILDALDFHAGSLDQEIMRATYTRPTPGIKRKPRHCIPPERI